LRRFPGVVLELRTARANGVPHGTIRFGRKPSKWSARDRLLALALTLHEDSLCPHCGQPKERSWNEDAGDLYRVHRVTCQGCQAMHHALDGDPKKPAEAVWVSDKDPDAELDERLMPNLG
jgi:rubredoxin